MGDIKESSSKQTIKCMIVGDTQTGKTILYRKLLKAPEAKDYTPTIFDIVNTEVEYNEEKVGLTFWDSAGLHVYDSIRPISYAHTDCFIICYRVDNRTSFENVEQRWLPEIIRHGDGPLVPVILVATQSDLQGKDLSNKDIVNNNEGEEMKQRIGARVLFQFSTVQSDAAIILEKATELACLKKAEEEKLPNPIWRFQSVNVIVAGDKKVGKSSLIEACIADQSGTECKKVDQTEKLQSGSERSTYEYYHDIVVDGCEYFFRITEIPSQDEQRHSVLEKCSKTDVIILCYAVDDPFSFQSIVSYWYPAMKNCTKESVQPPILLAGTKSDLTETSEIVIPSVDGEELMLTIKSQAFIECSAKTFTNVSQIFKTITDILRGLVGDSDSDR